MSRQSGRCFAPDLWIVDLWIIGCGFMDCELWIVDLWIVDCALHLIFSNKGDSQALAGLHQSLCEEL